MCLIIKYINHVNPVDPVQKTRYHQFPGMKIYLFYLSLLPGLFLNGCNTREQQRKAVRPVDPIELSFYPVPAEEQLRFYQNCAIDSIADIADVFPYTLLQVKNNRYNSLFMYLEKRCGALIFNSDLIERWVMPKKDSFVLNSSQSNCFSGADTMVTIFPGDSVRVYLSGLCSSGNWYHRYNFSFDADSLGQFKHPQILKSPCGDDIIPGEFRYDY